MNRPAFLRPALLAGTILQRRIYCRMITTGLLAVSVAAFAAQLFGVTALIDLMVLGFAAAAAAAFVSRFE